MINCVLIAVTTAHLATIQTDYIRIESKGKKVYVYNCEPGYAKAVEYFQVRQRASGMREIAKVDSEK